MYVETCYMCKKTGPYDSMNFCWVFAPGSGNDEHYTDLSICTDCLPYDEEDY